jgi:hypothetical protein
MALDLWDSLYMDQQFNLLLFQYSLSFYLLWKYSLYMWEYGIPARVSFRFLVLICHSFMFHYLKKIVSRS